MPIEFEPKFWWDLDTLTMRFTARLEGRTVRCAMAQAALDDLALAHELDRAGLEGTFRRHRIRIEAKAADKIRAGQFEADGTVLIRTADLHP